MKKVTEIDPKEGMRVFTKVKKTKKKRKKRN